MILSASRRTDIPAFYTEWFFNRLKEGFLLVRNPMNRKQVSQIELSPDTIDAIVFWSKNPIPLFERRDEIPYPSIFQFTITPYGKEFEPNVPDYNSMLKLFCEISENYSKDAITLRYDPIILNDDWDAIKHLHHFEKMITKIEGKTSRCIVSFIDYYQKTQRNMPAPDKSNRLEDYQSLLTQMANIAKEANIRLETCCEDFLGSLPGVNKAKCIDAEQIEKVTMRHFSKAPKRDKGQREGCRCIESIDIGNYDTCPHGCLYCYANQNVLNPSFLKNHDPHGPLLFGTLQGDEKISNKKMKLLLESQQRLV